VAVPQGVERGGLDWLGQLGHGGGGFLKACHATAMPICQPAQLV
jgi:hypothetical protein